MKLAEFIGYAAIGYSSHVLFGFSLAGLLCAAGSALLCGVIDIALDKRS